MPCTVTESEEVSTSCNGLLAVFSATPSLMINFRFIRCTPSFTLYTTQLHISRILKLLKFCQSNSDVLRYHVFFKQLQNKNLKNVSCLTQKQTVL